MTRHENQKTGDRSQEPEDRRCRGALPCAQEILREKIDARLKLIGEMSARVNMIEEEFDQRVEEMRDEYREELTPLRQTLLLEERNFITYLKQNKNELFNKAEKVTLPHGIVIHTTETRLSLPKNAVEAIEKLGWDEAIKIAKSVDREMVEKWPIEKIIAIGGDKKPKEKFEWELTEVKG